MKNGDTIDLTHTSGGPAYPWPGGPLHPSEGGGPRLGRTGGLHSTEIMIKAARKLTVADLRKRLWDVRRAERL